MKDPITRRGALSGIAAASMTAPALAQTAPSPAIVGLKQDSPQAIARTIKDQLLDTWSIEQFIPELELSDYRSMTSKYDMGAQLADIITSIEEIRPNGLLVSGGGRLTSNRTLNINANKIQTDLRCTIDMSGNDSEALVVIGSDSPQGPIYDGRRGRISGLKLIGESHSKGQVGIWLNPSKVGRGVLSQFVIENVSVLEVDTCLRVEEGAYCGSIERFFFYSSRKGIWCPGVAKPGAPFYTNSFERMTVSEGTMAGVETSVLNEGPFTNMYIRSVSFDYPVRFTKGPRFLVADQGSIDAAHCHFEGNNQFSPMDQADPEAGLFIKGEGGASRLTLANSKVVFSKPYNGLLFRNHNAVHPITAQKVEVFNAFGVDGFLGKGLIEAQLDPTPSPQTFIANGLSPEMNICTDTFEGAAPAGWTITEDGGPIQHPHKGQRINLMTSAAEARSGKKSLAVQIGYPLAPGSPTSFGRYLPISQQALVGCEVWIKKPGRLEGALNIWLAWVAGRYLDNGLFLEERADANFATNKLEFSARSINWTKLSAGGINSRAPSWATHIRLGFTASAINTAKAGSADAAGLIHIDDVIVTRLR